MTAHLYYRKENQLEEAHLASAFIELGTAQPHHVSSSVSDYFETL